MEKKCYYNLSIDFNNKYYFVPKGRGAVRKENKMTYYFVTRDQYENYTKWAETNDILYLKQFTAYFMDKRNFLTPEDMLVVEVETGKYVTLKQFAKMLGIV